MSSPASPAPSPSSVSWRDLPAEFVGGIDPDAASEQPINDLLDGLRSIDAGRSYLAYCDYQSAAVMHDRLVTARTDTDGFVVDGFADCAARIAKLRCISRHRAENLLTEAVALRDRLPAVFACLRDGLIAPWQAQVLIVSTDLIDDQSYAPFVDAEIAERLRTRRGTWSKRALRNMADRIIFRRDPNGVRDRRKAALGDRGVWTESRGDGIGEITATMSAENIRIAHASIAALAECACEHDDRTKSQRMSDAAFALLSGTAFECQCGREDCIAIVPEPGTMPPADAKIIIHVIADESTITGTADNPGYLDGHGVISDEHVRDIAARPDTKLSYLVPPGTPQNPDGTFTLSAHGVDSYRPSSALDTFIRVRDGICVEPGCAKSAFECDLDHVHEYDHEDPGRGGRTSAENLNAKCRPGHLLKTFGDWLDDQYRDDDGRLVTEFITPEGYVIPGEAESNEDLFPGLRRIRFDVPHRASPKHPTDERPTRAGNRVADKHARRRAERSRNRKRNNGGPPPGF
ncbi:DUF222 domain-containing protein [Gordonia sp. ABSL11-1]|uniref:HNH endonuclease signature motif containing protein n=1 Tax=Gordonia sp. ABSL11-1 TaxID=3053924 RepID=UPI002573340A|nr:HNH endonuclease signature motif containing protein [Gordonia sp. ABSL11-1]MDL9946938.1 DUF222 domain-containing protein [Gordonia sp. ABSL11-1]